MRDRAKEMAKKILDEHHPVYVNEKERKEIWKIAHEGQQYIAKKNNN